MIDPTDLRPIRASEFKLNGHFYLKNDDNTFSRCIIYPFELEDPIRGQLLRIKTKELADKGLLYIRINKPWQHFGS